MSAFWQSIGISGVIAALLAVIIFQIQLIFRGKLLPASTHDILMKAKDEQIGLLTQSRDSWENVADERAGQLTKALNSLSIVEKFFNEVDVVPRKGDTARVETPS